MFIMYVDDSGDPGANTAVTDYFILTALVVHELRWNDFINNLVAFREHLRDTKGLKLRHEIHSVKFISGRSPINSLIKKNDRLDILKQCLDWLARQPDISVYSVIVDKKKNMGPGIYELAWERLTQRFENTISYKNFPGPTNADERGIIISDRSDEKKLRRLVRKMHKYNPVTSHMGGYRNLKLQYIIEDPNFRDTEYSYILQMVDVASYFLMQKYKPNKYIRKKGARNYYDRLSPVLNKYVVKSGTGIVEI